MGAVPAVENKLADFFDELVKASMIGGLMAAKTFLLSNPDTAWLESPMVSPIVNAFLDGLAGAIYKQVGMVVANAVISVQTDLEEAAIAKATAALKSAESGGDKNAIDVANSLFASALGDLVHSDGSANPGSGPAI